MLPEQDSENRAPSQEIDERTPQPTGAKGSSTLTLSQRLRQLTSRWELFHDPTETAYATLTVHGHRETWPISASAIRDYLIAQCLEKTNRVPSERNLTDVVHTLEARARFTGSEHVVARRIAEHEGAIYVDLCDADWRVIRITAEGWTVRTEAPVRFVRTPGMLPLPAPVGGGSIAELRTFVNVGSEDDWMMLVAWIVAAFRPTGPYTILVVLGGEGSAKSSTTRVIRALLDPNEAPLRALPRDERDLAIAATNAWVVVFDNVSRLANWQSDALCRVATGSGFATRRLYTNNDEARFSAQRAILMNGIEAFVHREDLLSRTISITLPRISDQARRIESEMNAEFDLARSRILGALLDAVSGALRTLPDVKLERLPRMADFAQWVTAAETALGWKPGAFGAAYERNLNAGAYELLDSDPLATVILGILKHTSEWSGTPTDLLHVIHERTSYLDPKPVDLPKTARALIAALQRRATVLARAGVRIERPPRGHRGRIVVLHKETSQHAPESEVSPEVV